MNPDGLEENVPRGTFFQPGLEEEICVILVWETKKCSTWNIFPGWLSPHPIETPPGWKDLGLGGVG